MGHPALIDWTVQDAFVIAGGEITGSFTFNTGNAEYTNVILSYSGGLLPDLTSTNILDSAVDLIRVGPDNGNYIQLRFRVDLDTNPPGPVEITNSFSTRAFDGTGNNVDRGAFITQNPSSRDIPEPSTLSLLMLALAAVAVRRGTTFRAHTPE